MNNPENTTGTPDPSRRRGLDVTAIVMALVLLGVAAIGLSGDTFWLVPHLGPWLVAGAVASVGLGLILSTLPRRHRG